MTSALTEILNEYRKAQTEREKGTYFEELILAYLRHEASYRDLYEKVWMYADWAKERGVDARDTGIDLVAMTAGTNEYHAIQCKCYAENYRITLDNIATFLARSGQEPFTHRLIVTTTNDWTENAENVLSKQSIPVSKIDLYALENSQIDWSKFKPDAPSVTLKAKKQPRPHQLTALSETEAKLATADRGKLIMACGTGKTFTSLKIAEKLAGKGKRVLFLVPSLSLLSQSLTEWTQESETPLHCFAVCSDSDVGKKRKKDDDVVQTFVHELRFPATTNAFSLARTMNKRHDNDHMSVVFSTYHSIATLNEAQQQHDLADFDLIICDEAHRTTGSTFAGEEESSFVRVHDNNFIKGTKRIYMTATPRIYADVAKANAEKDDTALYSMDDENWYGKELYVITFSEAVERGLLVDYKVIVLAVDEEHVSARLQKLLASDDNQLKVDDAAKIIGCWKALSKQGQDDTLGDDKNPMKRAVAFCQVIEAVQGGKKHKVSSKNIAAMFQKVVEAYQEQESDQYAHALACEAEHVDGSMNASEKEEKLQWLKEETSEGVCRILSNVRCLSEGVDVPALDAVLFLTPRNSQVDVVQSVGRIMRNAEGKKRGYVILPVVIPAGVEPHEALNDNVTYKVVWEVLQALRSHDDRFDAFVNKLDLIGKDTSKMEVIAITDKIQRKQDKSTKTTKAQAGAGGFSIGTPEQKRPQNTQFSMQFEVGEIERALYAKVVKKCGNRNHWEDWANDIGKIARTHITRITTIVNDPSNEREVKAFTDFADELRDDLNDSITNDEVIEMLAQHLITKPVFDALFKDYSFASNNPVSLAMQNVLDILQEHRLDKEADTLEKFYRSVQIRAEGIDNAAGKQKIVVELYDKFFRNAFPRMTERLGIVYTPVEVVDFIIHSVNDVLQQEFGQSLGSKGVHIIDPFTGTGTFITRMLQSGLIRPEELPHKYKHEIHANEIVLLAYYIAAVNIEAVYHSLVGGAYTPFEGICLTDTFQLYEKDDLISKLMEDNSARRTRQKELDIRVIIGNPPYSAGQKSDNDNAANIQYPHLDKSLQNSYIKHSTGNPRSLYDNYIRAIRWASDRINDCGIIGFVSNAGFLDSKAADGLRKCLAEEFSSIYVFHLRGNARTSGELRRKEKDNVFGQGTRTPIAMSILVKNPDAASHGNIFFHDIGDYLSKEEKLSIIVNFQSITGIKNANKWQTITPDKHNDWLEQRDNSFDAFISLGDKKDKTSSAVFENYSSGLKSNRDAWAYNFSTLHLAGNMKRMIDFYNESLLEKNRHDLNDPHKISWSWVLRERFNKGKSSCFNKECASPALYRPFTKTWLYYDGFFNENRYLIPRIFPENKNKNLAIYLTGAGASSFSLIMLNAIPCLDLMSKGQCFPLYLYEESKAASVQSEMFAGQSAESGATRKDGITDDGLKHFQAAYEGEAISKEDVFYYVYGLLHSPDYRERYADNLSKQLPRIPCVKKAADFWAFSQAGRALADLHVNYETVAPYPAKVDKGIRKLEDADYYVKKMKFARKDDKTTIIYNEHITISEIPLEAYDYVVNGKAAIDWVMDRQCVKTDKDSGIVNDANLYAIETVGDASYPLNLLLRVITVSLETMKIIKALPALDIE